MTTIPTRIPTLLSADDPAAIACVAAAVRAGALLALPTDTVYGFAAALDQPHAIARLFQIKHRPHEKALPVLFSDMAKLENLAAAVPPCARSLMDRFWPGAITIVVPANPDLPEETTSVAADGTRTVALRIPDHATARAVLAASGGALAVTSANRSGYPPAVDVEAILKMVEPVPDIVLDGGPAKLQVSSTVVLAIGDEIVVLRDGTISASMIAEAASCRIRLSREDGSTV